MAFQFPVEAVCVEALLKAVGTVDPAARAIRKRREIVYLPPNEQASCSLLESVTVFWVVVLVDHALAHNLRDFITDHLEAQDKVARSG